MKTLYILRGLPGSGKSTEAKKLFEKLDNDTYELSAVAHYETDMFFTVGGNYTFIPALLKYAHMWCQSQTALAMRNHKDVIVSNTFTTMQELVPYLELAKIFDYDVNVRAVTGDFGSVHKVPEHTIRRMQLRWEEITDLDISKFFAGE